MVNADLQKHNLCNFTFIKSQKEDILNNFKDIIYIFLLEKFLLYNINMFSLGFLINKIFLIKLTQKK